MLYEVDIKDIELPYVKIWTTLTLFLIFSSTFFPIIGKLILIKNFSEILKTKPSIEISYYLVAYIVRLLTLIFPIFIINSFFCLKDIILLLIVMGFISGITNLLINIYFYRSFTFLILSFSDIVVAYISLAYSFIIKIKKFIYCKNSCNILAALIIMIPLFIQIAYYVADGIDRHLSKTKTNPEIAMASVVGLSISFILYIIYVIIFVLYPTFFICILNT